MGATLRHRYLPKVNWRNIAITLIHSEAGRAARRVGQPAVALNWGIGLALMREWKEYQPLRDLLKALTQLYSTAVTVEYRRLLFVRWKPPDQILAIGEADNVRDAVQESLQAFIRRFFPNFALTILHTGQRRLNAPVAHWP